jgi:hypothetical protein
MDEHGRVEFSLNEAEGDQVRGEATIPGQCRLLELVQGVIWPTDQIRVSRVDKVGGLAAVVKVRAPRGG